MARTVARLMGARRGGSPRKTPTLTQYVDVVALHLKVLGYPEPIREFRFASPRRFRADWAWPDRKLLVEWEGGTFTGGRHTSGAGFQRDCTKYNLAAALGYKVLRFTRAMVADGEAMRTICEVLDAA